MLKRIRTGLVASAIGITFALGNTQAVAAVPAYNGLVIFGDSLSDTGNVLSLTTAGGLPPFPSFPGGEGRFSNGPAWTEYLAAGLGFASSANPSNRLFNGTAVIPIGAPGGQNFAYGGARTGLGGSAGATTGLLGQLVAWDNSASILAGGSLTRLADPDALYVVVAGANDLRDIRSANFATDAASVLARASAATGVAQSLIGTLDLLATAGARHFLISSLPDLGLTPEAVALGQVAASTEVTLSFNSALSSLAGSFEAGFNQANSVDLDIRTLDFYGLFNNFVNDAKNNNGLTYGITNVATACISKGAFSGEYFFADATGPACGVAGFSDPLHPSARSHELLGALALQTVTAVPEPSEFALMIGGLLLIGGAVRRRRAQAA
jgi:phospholipase/lecithinase/hemolysin